VLGVEASPLHDHPLAAPQIDSSEIQLADPRQPAPFGKANSKNKAPIEGVDEVLVGGRSRRGVVVSDKEVIGVERGVQSPGAGA